MNIRLATIKDLEAIGIIESRCFPMTEAATKEIFKNRLEIYSNHFWLMEISGKVIGFVDGMVTNQITISDELFENAELHNEDGDWQAIFGVVVLPEYQKNGYAKKIIERVIDDAKQQNRKGCILTCKNKLLKYYEKFGFVDYGTSASTHGGEIWNDMRLEFLIK